MTTKIRFRPEDEYSRERLAKWMVQRGFATGHGDTFDDLLGELSWQVHEIQVRARRSTEIKYPNSVMNARPKPPKRIAR